MKKDDSAERKKLVENLMKLASSGTEVQGIEFEFLLILAQQMGISKVEFIQLIEQYIALYPPKKEKERILQMHRLILVISDGDLLTDEDRTSIFRIGIQMGLNPSATMDVLTLLDQQKNQSIDRETLIRIYATYHN